MVFSGAAAHLTLPKLSEASGAMDSGGDDWQLSAVTKLDPTVAFLRSVLPAGFGVAGGPIGARDATVFPAEEAVIARAVARRRAEFRAGRAYAREALDQLGSAPCGIGRGAGGEPLWPAGYTGSVSHTDDFAVAAVARLSAISAVGLDVEADTPLETSLAAVVCRGDELAAACAAGESEATAAKRILVAKEAFIKLSYALTSRPVEVIDIRIDFLGVTEAGQSFRATRRSAPRSGGFEGLLVRSCARIAAVMYHRRDDAR